MQTFKPYLLLTLLCALLYLPGIFTLPVVDRDAPHFAQATRQIVETGNYFQIKFQEEPRHLKPPGIYWLQALSVKAFSTATATKIWPYCLPSVFGGWLAVIATFFFARRFYGDKVALLAAALLASCLLLIIESHLVVTDAVLLVTMVFMQGALWEIYVSHRSQNNISLKWILLFWISMSAGILIKGITPLVGFLTLFSLVIVDGSLELIKKTKFLWGLIGLALLSCLWLIPLSFASHSNFLADMLRGDVLPKLVGGQQSHGMPPGYFAIIFNLMFWPGALFVWHGNLWAWCHRHQAIERFLIAWVIPTWLFFEVVPTKLPEYVLPVYPAMAILIAKAIIDWKSMTPYWQKLFVVFNRIQYGVWAASGVILAFALIYIPFYLTQHISLLSTSAAVVILLLVISAFMNIYYQQYVRAATMNVFGFLIVAGLMLQWVLPQLSPLWITEKVVTAIHEQYPTAMSATKPLLSIGYGEPSLVFMTGTKDVLFTSTDNALKRLRQGQSQLLLITEPLQNDFLQSAIRQGIQLQLVTRIHGFNYSRGKWETVSLYKVNSFTG